MRIHNWPTKALIIVAAAAALWLGLACQNPYPIIIAPTAPCGDYEPGQTLEPSAEFRKFPGDFLNFPDEVDSQEWNRAVEERGERLKLVWARSWGAKRKYENLYKEVDFLTIGYLSGWSSGIIDTEEGLPTDQYYVKGNVDANLELWGHKLDDSGRSPGVVVPMEVIPRCIDGYPVIFRIGYGQVLEPFYPPF